MCTLKFFQASLKSIANSSACRPLGFDSGRPAQPRARSRFHFANEQSSPTREAPASLLSDQPATPEPGYLSDGEFLFGKGLPNGHTLGVQGLTSSPLVAGLGAQLGEGHVVSSTRRSFSSMHNSLGRAFTCACCHPLKPVSIQAFVACTSQSYCK